MCSVIHLELAAILSISVELWLGPVQDATGQLVPVLSEPSLLILLDQHHSQQSCRVPGTHHFPIRADGPSTELQSAAIHSLYSTQMSPVLLLLKLFLFLLLPHIFMQMREVQEVQFSSHVNLFSECLQQ